MPVAASRKLRQIRSRSAIFAGVDIFRHADMRLQPERIDRHAALAESFEQAEHAGTVLLAVRLPAHIVVIDELGLGASARAVWKARSTTGLAAAHRLGEARLAHQAGFLVDRLVDHVIGDDAVAIVPADRLDMRADHLRHARVRLWPEIIIGQPGRELVGAMPQQCVPADLQLVLVGPVEDLVGFC